MNLEPDVLAIRTRLKLTRMAFADLFRLSASAVREWEQGRRKPDQAARVLLTVIEHNYRAVVAALEAAGQGG